MKSNQLKTLLIALIVSITSSCSNPKVKENSPSLSAETQRDETLERPKTDAPKALDPESRPTQNVIPSMPLFMTAASGPIAVAALAVAGTAIGISRVFRTPEARTDLNGNCVYGEPDGPMATPCINVAVRLLDANKNRISSGVTNRSGDFRFYIPSQQTYYVQVVDRKGREATTKMLVGRSEFVMLYLKP